MGIASETIQNNVQVHVNTTESYKMYMGETRMYGDNVKVTAISEFIKCLSEFILYWRVKSLHHQLLCLVETDRNVSPLFEVRFYRQPLLKTFPLCIITV